MFFKPIESTQIHTRLVRVALKLQYLLAFLVVMRSRKPKAQVLRHFESDSEETLADEGPQSKPVKLKKNKIKLKALENEDDDLALDTIDIKLQEKKDKKKKPGLFIPLFNEFHDNGDDDDEIDQDSKSNYFDLKQESISQRRIRPQTQPVKAEEKPEIISILPDEIDKINVTPDGEPVVLPNGAEEYISLEDDATIRSHDDGGDGQEDEGFTQDTDMLDDGRLALTENESKLQKKLHEMGIEEAIYEAELSNDDEMDDWQESRVRQGAFAGTDFKKTVHLPKFNLFPEESFHDAISTLQLSLQAQEGQKTTLQDQLNASIAKQEHLQRKRNDTISAYNEKL